MSSNKQRLIRQSNVLTTAAYSLKRNSKRLLYMALTRLNGQELVFNEAENGYEFTVVHSDYKELFPESASQASRDIHAAAKELRKEAIVFYIPSEDGTDGEKATKERNWATGLDHLPRQGKTVIYFNKPVIDMIPHKKGDPFTQYLLLTAGKLNNPYAMRLYETICQWRNTKSSVKHSVEWMLDRFSLPASYARMSDFRSKFLIPAIKEINEHTELTLYEPKELCMGSRKNKVTHIEFCWKDSKQRAKKPAAELTMKDAVQSYLDLINNVRLPDSAEIANLEKNLPQLGIEGFDLGSEFFAQLAKAKKAA